MDQYVTLALLFVVYVSDTSLVRLRLIAQRSPVQQLHHRNVRELAHQGQQTHKFVRKATGRVLAAFDRIG